MAMLFAAAIHDAEHTGTTNAFHVSIQSNLAKLYKVLGFKFYPAEIPKWFMDHELKFRSIEIFGKLFKTQKR